MSGCPCSQRTGDAADHKERPGVEVLGWGSRVRDSPVDDASGRQQGQAPAHGSTRVRQHGQILTKRPLDRVRPPPPRSRATASTRRPLFIVGAEGGPCQASSRPGARYVEHPTWSPDSRWIIVQRTPRGKRSRRSGPDGRGRHTILAGDRMAVGGHKPWFSPDGSRILLHVREPGPARRPARGLRRGSSASWTPTAPTSSTSPTRPRSSRTGRAGDPRRTTTTMTTMMTTTAMND